MAAEESAARQVFSWAGMCAYGAAVSSGSAAGVRACGAAASSGSAAGVRAYGAAASPDSPPPHHVAPCRLRRFYSKPAQPARPPL